MIDILQIERYKDKIAGQIQRELWPSYSVDKFIFCDTIQWSYIKSLVQFNAVHITGRGRSSSDHQIRDIPHMIKAKGMDKSRLGGKSKKSKNVYAFLSEKVIKRKPMFSS